MLLLRAPARGVDNHGSGAYGAPRGSRTHKGRDWAAWPYTEVLSMTAGEVTKLGRPYKPSNNEAKNLLRYVQITTGEYDLRYFYVQPTVALDQFIVPGDVLGVVQDLTAVYPDITPHVHFEVKQGQEYVNPDDFIARIYAQSI